MSQTQKAGEPGSVPSSSNEPVATEADTARCPHPIAERDRAERERLIRESLARLDAMPDYEFDQDDIYDDFGAPK